MATLQKFKLFATQCAAVSSPTRSPTNSPVIHLRRRKTLRMLLNRGGKDDSSPPHQLCGTDACESPDKGKKLMVRNKLKDLFVSSPEKSPETGGVGEITELAVRRIENRSLRPLSATFRQRLLRRVWRPMLVAIPE